MNNLKFEIWTAVIIAVAFTISVIIVLKRMM